MYYRIAFLLFWACPWMQAPPSFSNASYFYANKKVLKFRFPSNWNEKHSNEMENGYQF